MDWISPAPAKLNLCLNIIDRRKDGYHNLISLAAFTDFGDRLIVSQDRTADNPASTLSLSGPFASCLQENLDDNLVLKAKAVMTSAGFKLPHHHIHLEKHIPVSSGLGGGSADAAAYMRCAAKMMNLSPDQTKNLFDLAGDIGADVPVCLTPGYQIMRGAGTKVEPVDIAESGPVFCVLSNSGVQVSTAAVFDALTEFGDPPADLLDPVATPLRLETILGYGNDLYAPAVQVCPQIATLLEAMCDMSDSGSFLGIAMSGSGAGCFALTRHKQAADRLQQKLQNSGYWAVSTQLKPHSSSLVSVS